MINVVEISGREIPGDVYGVAYKFGERLDRSMGYMEYGGATITARKTSNGVIVIVAVTAGSFVSVPRLLGVNDGYNSALDAVGGGDNTYPLSADGAATQTLSFTENEAPEVSRDGSVYGNIDWKGVNTAGEGEPSDAPVLTWKGPTGRTIPFDFNRPIEGLTTSDIVFDALSTEKYTCFYPQIYSGGEVYATVPTAGDVEPKVLGAALNGNTLVCIVNNHYADQVGFFEEVWINSGDSEMYREEDHAKGWRKINSRSGVGRPTMCWFFNQSGTRATQGVSEYSINLEMMAVSFDLGTNTQIQYNLDNSHSNGDHSTTYSGSTAIWSDYKGDERVFAVVSASGGHNFTGRNTTSSDKIDAAVYIMGTKPVLHISGPVAYGGQSAYITSGGVGTVTKTWNIPACGMGSVTATDECGQTVTFKFKMATGAWIRTECYADPDVLNTTGSATTGGGANDIYKLEQSWGDKFTTFTFQFYTWNGSICVSNTSGPFTRCAGGRSTEDGVNDGGIQSVSGQAGDPPYCQLTFYTYNSACPFLSSLTRYKWGCAADPNEC